MSMEIVEATYKLWIDNLRVRHGRKFKNTYSRVVHILDRFTFIGIEEGEGRASFVVLMKERRDCRRGNKRDEQDFGVLMNKKQD